MKKFLLAVASSLLVAACLPRPRDVALDGSLRPQLPRAEARPGRALYRAGRRPPDAPPINITMGGQLAGIVTGNTWLLFDLAPGFHDLRAAERRKAMS